jgi:hypothetical protein
VLEDRTQNEMLERARMAVLLDAAAAPDKPLGRALKVATAATADSTLVKVVNEAIAERAKFAGWTGGGAEQALAQLSAALGVDADDTRALIEKEIVEGPSLCPIGRPWLRCSGPVRRWTMIRRAVWRRRWRPPATNGSNSISACSSPLRASRAKI